MLQITPENYFEIIPLFYEQYKFAVEWNDLWDAFCFTPVQNREYISEEDLIQRLEVIREDGMYFLGEIYVETTQDNTGVYQISQDEVIKTASAL